MPRGAPQGTVLNTVQYNVTLLPSVSTIARGMLCGDLMFCVHSSHIHSTYKTSLNYNNSKSRQKVIHRSIHEKSHRRKLCISRKKSPLHEVPLIKNTVLTKGIIIFIYNKLINRAGLLRCPLYHPVLLPS